MVCGLIQVACGFCGLSLLRLLVICCVWFRFGWIDLFSVDWLLLRVGCIRL